ncbi:MAG: FMN-binding protein [Treponema sp.]|jgi:major membrane immunogen (membrane-anchored lipoprotein)|nr:FMN-binding protein [Treponema sp.]
MTKKLTVLLSAAVFCFLLIGCPTETDDLPSSQKHAPYGDPPFSGEKSDTASSIHMEGPCKVIITLTLKDGYITNVSFEGSEGNTANVGGRVLSSAPDKIIAKNSVEIDAVSAATVTRNLVIEAGRKALAEIPGYDPE